MWNPTLCRRRLPLTHASFHTDLIDCYSNTQSVHSTYKCFLNPHYIWLIAQLNWFIFDYLFVVCQHVVYVNIPIQRQSRAICFLTSQHLQLTLCMTWLIWVKVFEKEYKVSLFCAHFWHMGTRATPSGVSINRPIHPLLLLTRFLVDRLICQQLFWPISAVFRPSLSMANTLFLVQEVPLEASHPVIARKARIVLKSCKQVPWPSSPKSNLQMMILSPSAGLVLLNDNFNRSRFERTMNAMTILTK